MPERVRHLAPLSDPILRLALSGLPLPPTPRVLDLCCGSGAATLLLARERQALCTAIDMQEPLLRIGREAALAEGLRERVEFLEADARHLEFPNQSFDLVLALGGALTYIGRPSGLERCRQLLRPGGCLLLTDLIYLDSPVPPEIVDQLTEGGAAGFPRPFAMEPAVRAVFEEGLYRYENEQSYRELLVAAGYEPIFAFPAPEDCWNGYYLEALRSRVDPSSASRIPVSDDELAAYYCWGGRWGVAYLICGARVFGAQEKPETERLDRDRAA